MRGVVKLRGCGGGLELDEGRHNNIYRRRINKALGEEKKYIINTMDTTFSEAKYTPIYI